LSKTIVAQEVLDLLALAASVNVQVARFSRSGAAVGAGAGAASARGTVRARRLKIVEGWTISNETLCLLVTRCNM
jgi:hypothetical protein